MLPKKTSEEGVALIKKFEGCELEAYRCSADVPTIGYGHTKNVSDGDTCTAQEAEDMLKKDLEEFEEDLLASEEGADKSETKEENK